MCFMLLHKFCFMKLFCTFRHSTTRDAQHPGSGGLNKSYIYNKEPQLTDNLPAAALPFSNYY